MVKKRKFTDAQVSVVLKEIDNGALIEDMCRKLGVSAHLQETYRVSERRSCGLMLMSRSALRYKSTRDSQEPLRMKNRRIVLAAIIFGFLFGTASLADDQTAGPPLGVAEQIRQMHEQRALERAAKRQTAKPSTGDSNDKANKVEKWSEAWAREQLAKAKNEKPVAIPENWKLKYTEPKYIKAKDRELNVDVVKDPKWGHIVEFHGKVKVPPGESAREIAEAFLKKNHKKLGLTPNLSELSFVRSNEEPPTLPGRNGSVLGTTVYEQVVEGLKVLDAELRIFTLNHDTVLDFTSTIKPIAGTIAMDQSEQLDSSAATNAVIQEIAKGLGVEQADLDLFQEPVVRLAVYVQDGKPIRVWKSYLATRKYGQFHIILEASSNGVISIQKQE